MQQYMQQKYHASFVPPVWQPEETEMQCNWNIMRAQLLAQWKRLSRRELDEAGPDRRRIAMLIQRKYGVGCDLAENYLRNFERTMPLLGCA